MAPHLLGLPRELRDKIYKNILVADNTLSQMDPQAADQARRLKERRAGKHDPEREKSLRSI